VLLSGTREAQAIDSSQFFPYPTDPQTTSSEGFLENLREDEVATILSFTQVRKLSAGEFVIRHMEKDRTLFVITAGSFEVLVPARRGPQRASIFGPGDIVGELAFFDAEPREADVRAREPSEVMALTPDGFDRLRIAYPRLALLFTLDLGRVLSLRFRQHNRRLAALGEL
jgi:CRP-like cAMP-binding protein